MSDALLNWQSNEIQCRLLCWRETWIARRWLVGEAIGGVHRYTVVPTMRPRSTLNA